MGKKCSNKSPSDEAYKSEGRCMKNKERKRLKEENKRVKKLRQIERRNSIVVSDKNTTCQVVDMTDNDSCHWEVSDVEEK